MNLFVLGWRPDGGLNAADASSALARLAAAAVFFDPESVGRWRSPGGHAALAWLAHAPDRVGDVRYVHAGEREMALFSGRPIRWTAEREADGREPLDPRFYLAPSRQWRDDFDGRWVAARYDDAERTLELVTDALGAYPVFETEAHGARWFSNSAEALYVLEGSHELNPLALAGLLGGGWSLTGDPVWAGVRRLPLGTALTLRVDGSSERIQLLPDERIAALPGAGMDADAAADQLVAALRALADWPGRPNVVPVTGGRDSRLILAAALRAGIEFVAVTGGRPDNPDVIVAQELCRTAGIGHALLDPDPHGDMYSATDRAAEVVALLSSGTACLADAGGFPLGPRPGSPMLWHTGQGGEIARGYYGRVRGMGRRAGAGELVEQLYAAFVGRRPGRAEIVNAAGARLLREHLYGWVQEQLDAGAAPADVPDLFYLLKRMATWAAPSHGCVEPVKDATSALWSRRLLPAELGLSTTDRARELFALRVLEQLAPELVEAPFADRRPWPARQGVLSRRAVRARLLAGKALAEVGRRARGARAGASERSGEAHDPFAAVLPHLRERILSQPSHPAWELLDRARVEGLLTTHPQALDTMSRYYAWRLATVFLVEDYAAGALALA